MRNVGATDRVLRILIGAGILAYFLFGTWSAWAYLGLVILATGLAGYCPIYHLLHINTAKKPVTG
jgi:DUF2892 family protein